MLKTNLKKAASATGKFVSDHRVAITAVTTAVITTIVVKKTMDNMNESAYDFMAKHNLLDEFYATFEDPIA